MSPTRKDARNIVLVTVDALRYDRTGYSGSGRGLTPNLDGLAEQGVALTQLFTQAVETPVAHAALFSGQFPRIRGFHGRLQRKHFPPRDMSLPLWLSRHGYRTGGFISAYALDRNRGFARGFDTYGDQLRDPDPLYRYHCGHALLAFEALKRIPVAPLKDLPLGKRRFSQDTIAAAASWLEAVPRDRPYFLFCHLFDTHCEYYSPEGFRAFPVRTNKRTLREFENGVRELTTEAREQVERQYDLSVAHSDARVGTLLDAVRSRSDARDTLVVVTADHGEGLGDHGYMLHGCELYDEELHVPAVIASLQQQLQPIRVDALLRTIDLAPTLLRLARLEAFPADGRDFCALLDGAPDSARVSFTETRHTHLEAQWLRALRSVRHKYIYDAKGREELYDLAKDPGETINVIAAERQAAEQLLRWQEREVGV